MNSDNTNTTDVVSTDVVESGMSLARRGYYRSRLKKAPGNKDSPYASKLQTSMYNGTATGVKGAEAASHEAQKNLMKKEIQMHAYKTQAKEAANASGGLMQRIVDKAEDMAGRIAEAVKEFVEDHPLVAIIALLILLVVLVVSGTLSSCSLMAGGGNNVLITTSFTATDADIRAVENDYKALEAALQADIDNTEQTYAGYDEYNYVIDEIGHDPFELAALLTVQYEAYTEAGVQGSLPGFFEIQYTLTRRARTEIRRRTETRWHYVTYYRTEERTGTIETEDGEQTYTYYVQVPYEVYESYEVEVEYEYKILTTTLINDGFRAAVDAAGLNAEKSMRFNLLVQTRGNRPNVFNGG